MQSEEVQVQVHLIREVAGRRTNVVQLNLHHAKHTAKKWWKSLPRKERAEAGYLIITLEA